MTITRRTSQPAISGSGEQILAQYEHQLRVEEDLTHATIRNYLSDLRHFAARCELVWKQGREAEPSFAPGAVTTPTLTDYRTYLQQELHLKPNSVNRSLISLKRYFAWLLSTGQMRYDPAKVVKLVGEEAISPRHLNDQEEQALVAAATEQGDVRDRTIIVLMLPYRFASTRTLYHYAQPGQARQAERNAYRAGKAQQISRDSAECYSSYSTCRL